MNKVFFIVWLFLIGFTINCGGGASSSGGSTFFNGPQGASVTHPPTGPTPGGPGGNANQPVNQGNIAAVFLMSPLNTPIDDGQVFVSTSPNSNQGSGHSFVASQSANNMEKVDLCQNDQLGAYETACMTPNGKLLITCANEVRKIEVRNDHGDVIDSFDEDCSEIERIQKIANGEFYLIFSTNSSTNEIVEHVIDLPNETVSVGQRLPTGELPSKVVSHPTGNMLYVLNGGDNTISRFYVSGISGLVHEVLPRIETPDQPTDLLINTQGSCLYLINVGAPSTVSSYKISPQGDLEEVDALLFDRGDEPNALTISQDGHSLYVNSPNAGVLWHVLTNEDNCQMPTATGVEIEFEISILKNDRDNNFLVGTDLYTNSFYKFSLSENGELTEDYDYITQQPLDLPVPCLDEGCIEPFNPNNQGASKNGLVFMMGKDNGHSVTKIYNGGLDLSGFTLTPSGQFAYATFNSNQKVEAFLVADDCSLIPFLTTLQGGDSLGAFVVMKKIFTPGQCQASMFFPGTGSPVIQNDPVVIDPNVE